MKRDKAKDANRKPSAPDFPALRDLFSGYLHQDFRAEYESPVAAAAAFRRDADPAELSDVLRQWTEWRAQLEGASLEEIAATIRKLGGAWQPARLPELDEVVRELQRK